MRRIKQILNAVPTKLNRIPTSVRRYVLEKYNYMCAGNIPGIPCNYNVLDALEIDHILPKSISGLIKYVICKYSVQTVMQLKLKDMITFLFKNINVVFYFLKL
jgi:hypothetical protein